VQWGFSGVSPSALIHLYEVAPHEIGVKIIDGVLRSLTNKDNNLVTRSEAALILSEFTFDFISSHVDEIAEHLLLCFKEGLDLAPYVEGSLTTQKDRYANFVMNFGEIEDLQRNSLYGLGRLYSYVSPDRQKHMLIHIVKASRSQSIKLRQGAAMALCRFESTLLFPSRLLVVLIALLHDPDAKVCTWACRAAGHLITSHAVDEHIEALLDRIIDLARTSDSTDIRVGATLALRQIQDLGSVPPQQSQDLKSALLKLSTDVSHSVRREVLKETSALGEGE
jgi:hypothetical protein